MKTIKEGACPYCASTDVRYDAIEVSDEGIYYPCTCNECGGNFEEHYNISFAGHYCNEVSKFFDVAEV